MAGADPCDSTSLGLPEPVRAARAHATCAASALGVPEELLGRGHRAGRARRLRAQRSTSRASSARRSSDAALPHAPHALAAYYLIAPAEASSQPRALRRRALRLPRAGRGDLLDAVHAHARGGLRRRGQAPHHARHLRAVVRLLRRLLRPRAAGAHADRRATSRAPSRASTSSSRRPRPTVAFELGAKTADPLAMYLNDFCTVPMTLAGIPAISIPNGLCRAGCRPGFQIAGPAFSENALLDAAYALEQAIGFDAPGRSRHDARVTLRAGHRARDPRPARHADEDVLRLRAVLRRAAEHAHLPGLPRACPARCRWSTRRRSTSGS